MAYDSNPNPPPPSSLPLGVAILAVLVGIFGFLVIVGGLLIVAGFTVATFLGTSTIPTALGYTGIAAGIIVLIVGLIVLGIALGLWHRRLWALVLALIVLAVELYFFVADFSLGHDFHSLTFLVSLVLFVYLLAVSRHFR